MPVKLDSPEAPTPPTALTTRIPASPPVPGRIGGRALPGRGEPGAWLDAFDALPDGDACPTLEGSHWVSAANTEFWRFDPGGVFTYGTASSLYSNGTWLQRGRHVYVETNGRYAERRGEVDGDVIRGDFLNVNGFAQPVDQRRISREDFDARTKAKR